MNEYKNLSPEGRIKNKLLDVLKKNFVIIKTEVLRDIVQHCWDAIKKEIQPPDLINYHKVVEMLQGMKYTEEEIEGPEMADYNYTIDKVRNKLKELKALSKKAE
jgi:hypothetical protein